MWFSGCAVRADRQTDRQTDRNSGGEVNNSNVNVVFKTAKIAQ